MLNRSVFLIEPDQKVRSVIAKSLVNHGYEVAVADHYRRAAEQIAPQHRLIVLAESIPG